MCTLLHCDCTLLLLLCDATLVATSRYPYAAAATDTVLKHSHADAAAAIHTDVTSCTYDSDPITAVVLYAVTGFQ
jgi:hypothetical protein